MSLLMRFAIIGCGTIAQIMHVPYVAELPDAELHALCDPASDRVQKLGDRYNVPHQFESIERLLDSVGDDLDAAIVLTPPQAHADAVCQLLEEDINTLVEKPLSVSLEDADRLVEAAESTNATTMVAYMKRYDPAFDRAKRELSEFDEVDLITAYDVDPDHGRIINEVYDLIDADVPQSLIEESDRKRLGDATAAVGNDDEDFAATYASHLEHICHDVNVLRGLFGNVEQIDHVDVFADGRYMTAHLRYDYDSETRCVLDSGFSNRKWFEEWIQMDAPDRSMTVEYGNPYIKNTPTEVNMTQGIEELSKNTYVPSYDESFKREINHFIRSIRGEETVRTPFTEARNDVRLIADLFRTSRDIDSIGVYNGGN